MGMMTERTARAVWADRYSLNSTCLCMMLLLSTGGCKLDMVSLVKEFFMHMKWKVGRSIYIQ